MVCMSLAAPSVRAACRLAARCPRRLALAESAVLRSAGGAKGGAALRSAAVAIATRAGSTRSGALALGPCSWPASLRPNAPQFRPFSSKVEIKTPDFGAESITEGTMMAWLKKAGDFCAKGDILAAIETDKITVEVKCEENGTLLEILVPADETVEVGQVLAILEPGGEAPPASAPAPEAAPAAPAAKPSATPTAAPAAAAPATPVATPAAEAPAKPQASAPAAASAAAKPERRVKMSRMRQSIAKRLKDAQNTSAMLTTFQEVDMSEIIALRKQYKDMFEQAHGVRLGFMSAFVKASSFALQQIPAINAVIDEATSEIIYRDYVDVSVAVASPRGLVVPVVRNVHNMSIYKVEATIAGLALKAKNEELTLEDMSGGTFTISNGGVFGSMLGTPIINPPQSAILGMHATKMRPVVMKNGDIVPRPIMYLALTYDHRLVDGREAVTFLCSVRDQIEDPRRLILEV